MESKHLVKVYPEMNWHWKSQGLILLIFAAAMGVGYFILPEWIVHNRFFFTLALAPVIYIVYTKYLNKSYSSVEEELTIDSNGKVRFRNEQFGKGDIAFYKYKVPYQSVTYGSIVHLRGANKSIRLLSTDFLENNEDAYEGTDGKHTNLAIDKETFDALVKLTFSK